MKRTLLRIAGMWLACGSVVCAQTAMWTNTTGGNWTAPANWQDGRLPGLGTNVDLNANGTYTSTVDAASSFQDLWVGTSSSAGTQMLKHATQLNFSNMTIGARGIVWYGHTSAFNGTGMITVASGGLWLRPGSGRSASYGSHEITIQSGGVMNLDSNQFALYNNPIREMAFTIDGEVRGAGGFMANNNGTTARLWLTGSGNVNAPIALNGDNGNVYLAGSLNLNGVINQSNAVKSAVILTNDANITLNGRFVHSGKGSVFLVWTNTASAVLTGTNLISVSHDHATDAMTFTGAKNGVGGTLTLSGSGDLEVNQGSTNRIDLAAAVLNLQRNARFWGMNNAGPIRPSGALTLNFTGAGKTMALETNSVLSLWNSNTVLNVSGGATLALCNGTLEGGSKNAAVCTNLLLGGAGAATLTLRQNSTNLFRRAADSTYALRVWLGPAATVSAQAGSVLQLRDCYLAVGITNPASWTWATDGTIECLTNATVEAMATDRGTNVVFSAEPFGIKLMRFSATNAMTLTLFNGGAADNDLDTSADAALYVETLDLAGMAAGTTLGLAGSGIAAPRLYYVTLVNPNGVSLSSSILPLGPQNGTVACTITNSPVPAGAQWRLTSGPDTAWKNTGAAINVAPGAYTQAFTTVPYYLTPAELPVLVIGGQLTNTQVGYVSNLNWGTVQVMIQPPGAVAAGAQWRLMAGPQTNWQASGAAVPGLEAGLFTVTYKPGIPLWFEPADDAVTVAGGATTNLTATYASVPVYTLTLESPYGQVVPPAGSTNYELNTVVTCRVETSPVTFGATQYVCLGWTRTGSSPGSGSGTNSSFTMTAHTVHTWLWETNYHLQTQAGFGGAADLNGTWWRSSSNATVTANPTDGYRLSAWVGDVPSGSETNNPLVLPMDRPRSVTATFVPIPGLTAIWTNTAGGPWSTVANWQGTLPPGSGTNADINASGTYTSSVQGAGTAANVAVGTLSASGTQTLSIDGAISSPLTFSNLTIGARGVFSYENNSFMYGTGLVTVAAGGQLYRRSGLYQGSFYGHDITVQSGGRWTFATGAKSTVGSDAGRDVTYTIDGTIDGGGTLELNSQNNRNLFTGTGRLDVAQIALNNFNGNLYLGGTLTVNSALIQSNANISATILADGADILLNGPYFVQGAGSVLLVISNTDSATIGGTNLISVYHDSGANATLTGAKVGPAGGTLTITGTGPMELGQASAAEVRLAGAVLNLQRSARLWSLDSANAPFKPTGAFALNVSGSNTVLTLDTNCVLRFHRGPATAMTVTNGATLAMRHSTFDGNGSGAGYNLSVGTGSAGTLALRANSTNLFGHSPDNTVTNYAMTVLLGVNATVSPEAGSLLQLRDCSLAVGLTNSSAWGWRSNGTLEVVSNAVLEALSTDRSARTIFAAIGFGINELRLSTAAASATVTVWNAGALDNDLDGTNDTALYVNKLNVSGLGGAGVVLANSGVPNVRLYYQTLVGGTVNQLGAGFVPLLPGGVVFTLR